MPTKSGSAVIHIGIGATARTARSLFPIADILTQRLEAHEQNARMLRSSLE